MKKIVCICIYFLFIMSLTACKSSQPAETAENNLIAKLEDAEVDIGEIDTNTSTNNQETLASSGVATPVPTEAPTPTPTVVPTPAPKKVPTPAPTEVPTPVPTEVPTPAPTAAPTPVPTEVPTPAPTAVPTPAPTAVPTPAPTAVPTPVSTATPTPAPECQHTTTYYVWYGGHEPTCTVAGRKNIICTECDKYLGDEIEFAPHEPDEDYWNRMNVCENAATGYYVSIPCIHCGVNTGNRLVTATHNYVPSRTVEYIDAEEGYVTMKYLKQEYECTGCGTTYTEHLKSYVLDSNGEWVEW